MVNMVQYHKIELGSRMPPVIKIYPLLIALLFILYSGSSNARLVMFSRANCFIPYLNIGNESISWDPVGNHHWLWTVSLHFLENRYQHLLNTGWDYTNRSAATHKDYESQNMWLVVGYHFKWTPIGGLRWVKLTSASDCNF